MCLNAEACQLSTDINFTIAPATAFVRHQMSHATRALSLQKNSSLARLARCEPGYRVLNSANPLLYTLHPTPYTLIPATYTLHLTHCTLHPAPHRTCERFRAVPKVPRDKGAPYTGDASAALGGDSRCSSAGFGKGGSTVWGHRGVKTTIWSFKGG